jgi:hypothetical protein
MGKFISQTSGWISTDNSCTDPPLYVVVLEGYFKSDDARNVTSCAKV